MTGAVGLTFTVMQLEPGQVQPVAQTVYAPTVVPLGMVKVRTELVPLPGVPDQLTTWLSEFRTTHVAQLFKALLGKLTVKLAPAKTQLLESVSMGWLGAKFRLIT